MARKSRKQIAVEEPVIESVSSEVFSTAVYARLSVENSGKSEKVGRKVVTKHVRSGSFVLLTGNEATQDARYSR